MSALERQVGGEHYKKLVIQPIEYIHLNDIGFIEGSVIKYVTRWRDKGGLEDIKKAIHYLHMLLEFEGESNLHVADECGPAECGSGDSVALYDAGYRRIGGEWVKSWPGVRDE